MKSESDGGHRSSVIIFENGAAKFTIKDWFDDGTFYGGCMYSKRAFMYGTFTASMRIDNLVEGHVPR